MIAEDNNSTPQTFADEINVCAIFCSYQHVALAGCSPCKQQNTITEDNDTMDNSNTPVASHNQGEVTDRVVMLSGIENSTTTSATTTTPDWNQLCAALCKTGDGGSLCNCDLSPFFVWIKNR